jgi:hypothetical protein
METATLKDHYIHLRDTDKERWDQFRAALALHGFLTTFERSVLAYPDYNLRKTPSWIRSCIEKYLGFSAENFDNNEVPALPEVGVDV